jgi:hypothetical protein
MTGLPAPVGLSGRALKRSLVLLLLIVGVIALSILARQSPYLPKSDAAHYFSSIASMNVTYLPVAFVLTLLCWLPGRELLRPAFHSARPVELQNPELPQIGLTLSLQHRSPPSLT